MNHEILHNNTGSAKTGLGCAALTALDPSYIEPETGTAAQEQKSDSHHGALRITEA
jgi:hypothetical protein